VTRAGGPRQWRSGAIGSSPSACIIGLALVLFLALGGSAPAAEFRTSDITGQGYGGPLTGLVAQDGIPRSIEDFKGEVTVLLFGFTHCPDVCPISLLRLSQVMDLLGEERDRVRVAFVTIDPERDRPEVLREYLGSFGPNFLGLTGPPQAIRQTARDFKVFYQKVGFTEADYTMDHGIAHYVIDPQARVRLMFTPAQRVEDVAHDILALLHAPD
jgi:protein SCO1/2